MKKPYSRAQYKRKGNSSKAAKLMFGYVWQNKDLFYLYWPVVLGMEVLAILARVMFSQILDKLEAGSHDTLALLLVAVIMTDLIHLGFDIMYVKVVVRNFEYTLLHRLTMQVMRHISALGAEFYSSVPAALIKDRVNKIYLVSSLISQASWSVFTHLLQIVVSLVLILIYLPNTLGLWLVAVVTYSILVFLRMNQLMYRAQTPSRRRRKDIEESGVSENRDRLIDANATLVTNAALGSTLSRLDRDYTHLLKVGMIDLSFLFYGAGLQRDLVLMYGRRGCLAISVLYAVNGWISVAELVLINTLVETMFIGMWGVSRFLYSFIHDSESILKLDELMKLQPTVKCPDDPKAVPVGPLGFQLQNVGFTYPDLSLTLDEEETQIMSASNKRESENGHLQNIGLVIEAGQRVALVGPSGAGKTTLAGLLGCTRYPTEGSVLVNGIDITQVDPQKIWDRIAFVPQGTAIDLFNDTLLYNITLGRRYSEATVIEVLKLVDLWDTVVSQWPLGIQEKIGERGRTLSGGQQQRVAIARALIRNPDLLILDEATSSLDVQTERIVQKSVEELPADTTVVIIAHRLSTIRNVDVIAVLQDGKIVDSGSWEDLVDRCELFEEMVALQNLG